MEATQIVLARMPEADKLYMGILKTNREKDNNQRGINSKTKTASNEPRHKHRGRHS